MVAASPGGRFIWNAPTGLAFLWRVFPWRCHGLAEECPFRGAAFTFRGAGIIFGAAK